jgi:LysR family transcriptional regulator for bpeEF and oprC
MEMFVKVVEHAGFSKAAAVLQISPGKVSSQISNLEQQLGVQLLSRTTRMCTLTEDGETYYAHCKRVIADISATREILARSHGNPRGRLRIDSPGTLTHRLLLPVLVTFQARYPDIELQIFHTDHVYESQREGFDVMLRLGPLQDSGLVARQLGIATMITAAAPAYLTRYGEPKTPRDLEAHRCIHFLDSDTGRVSPWEFRRADEHVKIRPPLGLCFNLGEARLAAVTGLGIYCGMRLGTEKLLAEGSLKLLLQDWAPPPPPVYVVYEHHNHLPDRVPAFVNFILECFPPGRAMEIVHNPAVAAGTV